MYRSALTQRRKDAKPSVTYEASFFLSSLTGRVSGFPNCVRGASRLCVFASGSCDAGRITRAGIRASAIMTKPDSAARKRSAGIRVARKGDAALVPLWRQVYTQLRESIENGSLPVGALIPASRVLAKELRVARNTVEAAIARLVSEGLVERRVGSGTRVTGTQVREVGSVQVSRDGELE